MVRILYYIFVYNAERPKVCPYCVVSLHNYESRFTHILSCRICIRAICIVINADKNIRMFGVIKTLVRGLQKPEFGLLSSTDKYEERRYKQAKWVATTVKGISHKEAASEGFRRLFRYISGDNEKNTKVEMTVPVTTWVDPGAGPNCESSFTIAFYIPSEHQADPPKPSNPQVFIEDRSQFTAYVSTFGGFPNDEMWVQKAVELGDAVGDHSKFNNAQYYTAGYDPPFKPFGRTNEVWFVKNESCLNGSSVDDKAAAEHSVSQEA